MVVVLFWSLVFMINCMSEVIVVGLIAQVWFVLHCLKEICFRIQKEKKKQKFEIERVLED